MKKKVTLEGDRLVSRLRDLLRILRGLSMAIESGVREGPTGATPALPLIGSTAAGFSRLFEAAHDVEEALHEAMVGGEITGPDEEDDDNLEFVEVAGRA